MPMELTVPVKTAETGLGTLQTSINHTDDLKTFLRDPFLLFDELKLCCGLSPPHWSEKHKFRYFALLTFTLTREPLDEC